MNKYNIDDMLLSGGESTVFVQCSIKYEKPNWIFYWEIIWITKKVTDEAGSQSTEKGFV